MKRLCQIYRSPRRGEMYLFVDKERGLEDVPEVLLRQFGKPEPVMTLLLAPERRLARADTAEVLAQIEEQGFYLQMRMDHSTPKVSAMAERRQCRMSAKITYIVSKIPKHFTSAHVEIQTLQDLDRRLFLVTVETRRHIRVF